MELEPQVDDLLDGVREATKDTASHVVVAALVTFAHENVFISIFAVIGTVFLALAWGVHLYYAHKARLERRRLRREKERRAKARKK